MLVETVNMSYNYGDTFKILPIADIHLGNKTADIRKLKSDLEKNCDEKTIILGIGDWLDSIIVSDMKRYNKDVDDSKSGANIDEQIQKCIEIFNPYKQYIVGIGEGNHEEVITRKCGTNSIQRLCEALSTPEHPILNLGYSWLLDIIFSDSGRSRTLTIRGHHGWGGNSRTEGADVTKFSHDVKFWRADLFLYGHVHKLKLNDVEEGRKVGKNQWKTFKKRMLVCGTYQRTFMDGTVTTWAETRGFHPAQITHPIVYVKPLRESGCEIWSIV